MKATLFKFMGGAENRKEMEDFFSPCVISNTIGDKYWRYATVTSSIAMGKERPSPISLRLRIGQVVYKIQMADGATHYLTTKPGCSKPEWEEEILKKLNT